MSEHDGFCCRCKKRPVEVIDGWRSSQCGPCNDRDIERTNERREWDYYHPPFDDDEAGQWGDAMTDKLTDLERELWEALEIALPILDENYRWHRDMQSSIRRIEDADLASKMAVKAIAKAEAKANG
jgi:hypothetical protein